MNPSNNCLSHLAIEWQRLEGPNHTTSDRGTSNEKRQQAAGGGAEICQRLPTLHLLSPPPFSSLSSPLPLGRVPSLSPPPSSLSSKLPLAPPLVYAALFVLQLCDPPVSVRIGAPGRVVRLVPGVLLGMLEGGFDLSLRGLLHQCVCPAFADVRDGWETSDQLDLCSIAFLSLNVVSILVNTRFPAL